MEKVKVGIAGLGRSGWNIHAELLSKLSEKYLGYCCLRPERRPAERSGKQVRVPQLPGP